MTTSSPSAAVVVHPGDNVATLLRPFRAGELLLVGGREISANQDIPIFHKIAIRQIDVQSHVYKFGASIGIASVSISRGDHVHIHNIISGRARQP